MIDIDELKKTHETAIAKAVESNIVEAMLPAPPKYSPHLSGKSPWISYEVDTMDEAVSLYRKFGETVPWQYRSGTFGHLCPEELLDPRYADTEVKLESDGCPYIEGNASADYNLRETALVFFWRIPGMDKIACISIKVKSAPLTPKVVALNDHHRCRTFRKDYPKAGEDRIVQWAHGGKGGARGTWLWCYEDGFLSSARTFLGLSGS